MSFKLEKKVIEGHSPRFNGSTVRVDDQIKLVYNKYSNTAPIDANKIRFNIIFNHGTGLNKMSWHYLIVKLYELSAKAPNWYLGSVIAWDIFSHGDSALLNAGKIGWTYGWTDSAKDVSKILDHERATNNDFLNNRLNKTITVGHSLGGYTALLCGYAIPEYFDTVVPIEAAWYKEAKMSARMFKRFKNLAGFILDTFDSYEDFKEYYTEMSYYKTMVPEVMDDFLQDEYYTVKDAETGEIKYKSKASRIAQVVTYLSAYFACDRCMAFLPFIDSKVCFITGKDAVWNPPQSITYFRDHVKPSSLLEMHDVPGASHLAAGDKPDDVVDILYNVIQKRADAAIENKDYFPEILYKGNSQKIAEEGYEKMLNTYIEEAVSFQKVPTETKL